MFYETPFSEACKKREKKEKKEFFSSSCWRKPNLIGKGARKNSDHGKFMWLVLQSDHIHGPKKEKSATTQVPSHKVRRHGLLPMEVSGADCPVGPSECWGNNQCYFNRVP